MKAFTYLGIGKVATVVFGTAAAAIVVVDPSVKVAIIAVIPLTITSIGGLWMQFLARSDTKKLQASVVEVKVIAKQAEINSNDMLSKLQEQRNAATTRADHAEGKQEEREERRERDKPLNK